MHTLPDMLPVDPFPLLQTWFEEALQSRPGPNPDALMLATVSADGQPAVRAVLCRGIVATPGYLVFYTNYQSAKARDIETHEQVAGVFHWDTAGRQLRFEGKAVRSPADESDRYFAARDRQSQIGAWASQQSAPLASRAHLKQQVEAVAARFGDRPVPRPPHWGGYRIWLQAVELWLCGDARLHDRARWERSLERLDAGNFSTGPWRAQRLQP